jgi:prevent-host-death family protein
MKEVALYEAKNKLSALLDEVATGKQITITRHGKAVARLVPEPAFDRAKARQAAEGLLEMRKRITLGPDLTIKQLIDEGRRS